MKYWQAIVTAALSAALARSSLADRGFVAHAIENVLILIAFGALWLFLKFINGPRDRDGAEGGDANAAPVPQDRQARAEGIAQTEAEG